MIPSSKPPSRRPPASRKRASIPPRAAEPSKPGREPIALGSFEIPGLPPPRRVRVHVPLDAADARSPAHAAAGRPTLLLFDGQNAFDDEGSFAGGWYAHHAADRLVRSRTAAAPVVVALDHGGALRLSEMSAWPEAGQEGRANEMLDWISGSLLPRLHSELGVATDPAHTVVGGSSMGGLAALYAHFRHPEVFGGALVMSPSLWVGARGIFDYVATRARPARSRIYLDCGAREGDGKMLPVVRAMADHLRDRGWSEGELCFRADPRGTHNEKHWRRRLPAAMRFLFRR